MSPTSVMTPGSSRPSSCSGGWDEQDVINARLKQQLNTSAVDSGMPASFARPTHADCTLTTTANRPAPAQLWSLGAALQHALSGGDDAPPALPTPPTPTPFHHPTSMAPDASVYQHDLAAALAITMNSSGAFGATALPGPTAPHTFAFHPPTPMAPAPPPPAPPPAQSVPAGAGMSLAGTFSGGGGNTHPATTATLVSHHPATTTNNTGGAGVPFADARGLVGAVPVGAPLVRGRSGITMPTDAFQPAAVATLTAQLQSLQLQLARQQQAEREREVQRLQQQVQQAQAAIERETQQQLQQLLGLDRTGTGDPLAALQLLHNNNNANVAALAGPAHAIGGAPSQYVLVGNHAACDAVTPAAAIATRVNTSASSPATYNGGAARVGGDGGAAGVLISSLSLGTSANPTSAPVSLAAAAAPAGATPPTAATTATAAAACEELLSSCGSGMMTPTPGATRGDRGSGSSAAANSAAGGPAASGDGGDGGGTAPPAASAVVATMSLCVEAALEPLDQSSSSLYIKNLPPEADELWMFQRFAPHGALLSVKPKMDSSTGLCRGIGFVNYADTPSAERAMQQLNGTRTSHGRQLHITLQAPRAVRAAAAATQTTTTTNASAGSRLSPRTDAAAAAAATAAPLLGSLVPHNVAGSSSTAHGTTAGSALYRTGGNYVTMGGDACNYYTATGGGLNVGVGGGSGASGMAGAASAIDAITSRATIVESTSSVINSILGVRAGHHHMGHHVMGHHVMVGPGLPVGAAQAGGDYHVGASDEQQAERQQRLAMLVQAAQMTVGGAHSSSTSGGNGGGYGGTSAAIMSHSLYAMRGVGVQAQPFPAQAPWRDNVGQPQFPYGPI